MPHIPSLSPSWQYRNGPWTWNTSLPTDKEPTQSVRGYHLTLCGNICAHCRTISTLFSLLKVCVLCGTQPTPLLYLSSAGKGQGSFYCGRTGLCMGSLPFHCGLERATGHGGPMVAIGAGLPPSLLCVGGSIRCLALLCSPWRLLYLNAMGGGVFGILPWD